MKKQMEEAWRSALERKWAHAIALSDALKEAVGESGIRLDGAFVGEGGGGLKNEDDTEVDDDDEAFLNSNNSQAFWESVKQDHGL